MAGCSGLAPNSLIKPLIGARDHHAQLNMQLQPTATLFIGIESMENLSDGQHDQLAQGVQRAFAPHFSNVTSVMALSPQNSDRWFQAMAQHAPNSDYMILVRLLEAKSEVLQQLAQQCSALEDNAQQPHPLLVDKQEQASTDNKVVGERLASKTQSTNRKSKDDNEPLFAIVDDLPRIEPEQRLTQADSDIKSNAVLADIDRRVLRNRANHQVLQPNDAECKAILDLPLQSIEMTVWVYTAGQGQLVDVSSLHTSLGVLTSWLNKVQPQSIAGQFQALADRYSGR